MKYRILREAPEQKFLLYREGPPPSDLENWLLDVELTDAEAEFRTDQVAIWLTELELNYMHAEVIEAHKGFFERAPKRLTSLKKLLKPNDGDGLNRLQEHRQCKTFEVTYIKNAQ